MRFGKVLVFGLAALAGAPAVGRAQSLDPPVDLRSGFDAESQPVDSLAAPPAHPLTPAADLVADEPETGRVEKEGQAEATNQDDDLATASVRKPPEDDPFAPLGIRAGGFIFLPSVALSAGHTTNASGIAGGTPSGYWTVAPELLFKSDWAEHEATLTMRGSYQQYTDGITESQPTASIEATGRVDLPDEWTVDLKAGYDFSHQSVSDPNFPAGVDEAPGVHDLISTAALNGNLGHVDFTVEGAVERTIYENGLAGLVVVDQGDRTNTIYSTRVRVGYALTPSITPFVEGEFGWRAYDRPIDDDGIARSSRSMATRTGIAYDGGPILKGEIAVGVARETFDDASLAALRALTVDGSLTWAPTPLVTVTLNASTAFSPSTDPLSSGSIVYDASLDLDYAWRRNVTLKWTAGVSDELYQGIDLEDRTLSLGFGWVWKLNRTLHLTGDYVHQWLVSSDPTADYQSDTVTVGLRLQR